MKYALIFVLITLATFASGKPVNEEDSTKYHTFLTDILSQLAKRKTNGVSYNLVEINSVTNVEAVDDKTSSCIINADLKDENEGVKTCEVDISLYRQREYNTLYNVRFRCNGEILADNRYVVAIKH